MNLYSPKGCFFNLLRETRRDDRVVTVTHLRQQPLNYVHKKTGKPFNSKFFFLFFYDNVFVVKLYLHCKTSLEAMEAMEAMEKTKKKVRTHECGERERSWGSRKEIKRHYVLKFFIFWCSKVGKRGKGVNYSDYRWWKGKNKGWGLKSPVGKTNCFCLSLSLANTSWLWQRVDKPRCIFIESTHSP